MGYFTYNSATEFQMVDDVIHPFGLYAPENPVFDYLIRLGDDQYSFFCSGVVISKDFALTAAHCVVNSIGLLDTKTLHIYNKDNNFSGFATTVSLDKSRDIALLKGNFSKHAPIKVDWQGATQTDMKSLSVYSCGFPSGENLYCSKLDYNGNMFFQMSFKNGQLYRGQSGGPVIAYADFNTPVLIGVNSAVSFNSLLVAPVVGMRSILWGR
jgi:V8-like Glu-specific endopeptidase